MLLPPDSICTQPEDESILWRYMDFTKFMEMLESNQLQFARSDLFDDPYEGQWSNAGVRAARANQVALLGEGVEDPAFERLLRKPEQLRRQMFMSCWSKGTHESAALWRLYLGGTDGVAVKTSWLRLKSALEASAFRVRATMINYVDYDEHPIPFTSVFWPFVYKRLSFSYETEFRAIVWSGDVQNRRLIRTARPTVGQSVNLNQLIDSVHVAPTSKPWFLSLVRAVMIRYKLHAPITQSSLYDRPAYKDA